MSEIINEVDPEQFVGEPPAGDASPDEFVSNDQSAVVSEETGTVYERVTGEPAVTPHDEVLEHQEEEEEDA
jgi:hypothetical protein